MPDIDTPPESLRARLAAGAAIEVAWLALGSPAIAEAAAGAQPAAIVFDLQHGLWTPPALAAAVGFLPAGVPAIGRVAENSAAAIGTALDCGLETVLVPLVDGPEEAAAAVSHARFPPEGTRSGGGVRPLLAGFPAYVAAARARTGVGVMIETVAGVAAAAAIARTPGLDFVFIGTGDLALSLGAFPTPDDRLAAACAAVLAACRAAGVPCGIFTSTAEDAAARLAEGYAMAVAANDIDVVKNGFSAALAGFREGRP